MFIASLITATIAVALAIFTLLKITDTKDRRVVFFCFVCTLPMCWVMYHGIRIPFDDWLKSFCSDKEILFWIRMAYAPLTEEPAKLWPLLIPAVRRSITKQNVACFAIALGVGFAVGEVFTVAGILKTKMPEISNLPWFALGGFISERLMTCFVHSAMTGAALLLITKGYGWLCGLGVAMPLHFFANFPIGMWKRGWLGNVEIVSQSLIYLWTLAFAIGGCIFLYRLTGFEKSPFATIFGDAICPSCNTRYQRSVKGINFGLNLRYEPCPKCKKWHWTKRTTPQDNSEDSGQQAVAKQKSSRNS